MKIVGALLLLALGGCGSFVNLGTGPQVYGGVRTDLASPQGSSCNPFPMALDIPFSAVVDTGLLPLTALFELVRWVTGWPPPGVK